MKRSAVEWGRAEGKLIVHAQDLYGGYEWDQFRVLQDPDHGVYWYQCGRGCSCNHINDALIHAITKETFPRFVEAFHAWQVDPDRYDKRVVPHIEWVDVFTELMQKLGVSERVEICAPKRGG